MRFDKISAFNLNSFGNHLSYLHFPVGRYSIKCFLLNGVDPTFKQDGATINSLLDGVWYCIGGIFQTTYRCFNRILQFQELTFNASMLSFDLQSASGARGKSSCHLSMAMDVMAWQACGGIEVCLDINPARTLCSWEDSIICGS
eukprot:TRINITY_DN67424_c0_g2_i5.p1 TRINITY_DN67424_c0_g2~~TRINITY_DN67424_c0_g2_i5.p1  ORF type:complete len:144 (+),score=9.34 TRINITY_DN67424_c0_g2_i5:275-706(+)